MCESSPGSPTFGKAVAIITAQRAILRLWLRHPGHYCDFSPLHEMGSFPITEPVPSTVVFRLLDLVVVVLVTLTLALWVTVLPTVVFMTLPFYRLPALYDH